MRNTLFLELNQVKEAHFFNNDYLGSTHVFAPLTLTACGPSDGKEVKDVFGRPGACVEVGSAR